MERGSPKTISARGSAEAHQLLVNQILLSLNPFGRFWSNKTGAGTTSSGRFIKFGLVGSPDIIGVQRGTGKFVGIEVKTGNAVQSSEQISFEKMIKKLGGVYILARSIQDAISELKN